MPPPRTQARAIPAGGVRREPGRRDMRQAVTALGALAQETRLALFRLLVQHGPAGLPAGVLAERLAVPPSSLSFHLAQLMRAGLITQRRVSRQQIYAADYEAMNGLMAFLTENCCDGATVCGPAACHPAVTPAPGANHETPAHQRRR